MLKKINKENIVFIVIIFLLSVVFLHSILSASKIMSNIHHINDVTFISHNLKEALFKYGELHLWTPYYYSGQPLYAQPEYYFLDFNFLYLLLFRNIFIAMNLATLTYLFLSGLGMYFLFLAFNDNKKAAFIAAVLYMFNGYMHSFVINGNLNVLAGYSLIPFAFMFFAKALQHSATIRHSILSGLFIALQIFAGGTLLIPYEIVLFGFYALFYLFGKGLKKRLLKLALAGAVVLFVSFGISAIKLLPGIEFISLSNRASGVPYNEYLGEPVKLSSIAHILVTNLMSDGISASIGIAGFLLLAFSLYNYKKRYVIFAFALLIFSLLMAKRGFISDLFYRIPIFAQLRHIERALFLTAFASSILAGAGSITFFEKIGNAIKIKKKIIFPLVIIIILAEILLLQNFPKAAEITKPDSIPVNAYISKDKDTFRTINLALSTLVGASGYNYLAQLGIGTIKGGSGIWFNDYLAYLSIAQQSNPAKLWGMLNNKYVISDREINISGLKLISKFIECKSCAVWEAYGPYLYENLEFMPRAFTVDKSILVVGSKQDVDTISYGLILHDDFNPKKVVIIQDEKLSENFEELSRYDALIVSGSIEDEKVQMLKRFADSNKILLPDIFNGKNLISQDDIKELFKKLNGSFEKAEILEYENNKAVYKANKKGFLVLSERFSNFPGWVVAGKEKKEILRANVITTAVFADNGEEITFKYMPKPFVKGLAISLATSLLILAYFGFAWLNRGGKNKNTD